MCSVVSVSFCFVQFPTHLHEVSRLTLALAALILPDAPPGPFQTPDGGEERQLFIAQSIFPNWSSRQLNLEGTGLEPEPKRGSSARL